jgi:cupin fold WbuC family metalloprotein
MSTSSEKPAAGTDRLRKILIDRDLLEETLLRARNSERLRTNFNFHASMDENPHRFLNVMLRDTYITPHRHLHPPKAESFLILVGRVAFFTFREDGAIATCDILSGGSHQPDGSHQSGASRLPDDLQLSDDSSRKSDALGIDISPGFWHTLVVLSEYAICFEVKPGPYRESDDKEFASWAPREGVADAARIAAYRRELEDYANRL